MSVYSPRRRFKDEIGYFKKSSFLSASAKIDTQLVLLNEKQSSQSAGSEKNNRSRVISFIIPSTEKYLTQWSLSLALSVVWFNGQLKFGINERYAWYGSQNCPQNCAQSPQQIVCTRPKHTSCHHQYNARGHIKTFAVSHPSTHSKKSPCTSCKTCAASSKTVSLSHSIRPYKNRNRNKFSVIIIIPGCTFFMLWLTRHSIQGSK